MNMMIEGLLAAGHKVKIIALNSFKYNTDIESIPASYRNETDIELVYTNLRINPFRALLHACVYCCTSDYRTFVYCALD